MPVRTWRFTVWLLFRIHLHILDVTKPRSGTMIWSLRGNVFLGCQRVRQCIKVWNAPLFKKNTLFFAKQPWSRWSKKLKQGKQRRSKTAVVFPKMGLCGSQDEYTPLGSPPSWRRRWRSSVMLWDCFALHLWLFTSSYGIVFAILSFLQGEFRYFDVCGNVAIHILSTITLPTYVCCAFWIRVRSMLWRWRTLPFSFVNICLHC